MTKDNNIDPTEVSFEDAAQAQQLKELMEQKMLSLELKLSITV